MVNLHAPKRTIPRTRPKKQPKAEPKDSIRAQLDQAQQGLDSMRELVDVLEAENVSFGRYIESAKGSSSDEEPERQRGGLADDGESCFLTGLHHPGVSPIASPRRVDESESDTASSSSSEYDGEAKLEAAMLDCAVAKRKAKRNARRGTIKLRADDEREVKSYQESVDKLKAERRRKEEDLQPKPMVRTVHDCPEAISRLARPEPRPEPRIYSEPQPTFQAKPLPKTYGAPAARSGTIVERSQAWLAEKRALRDAERERRRKEKEAEVTAKPRLADPEAWAKAKDEARAARAKAELEELEREQMKELREAKKDQLRRQKADEIAAMRAALKAQAQQRAAKRGKRKDGRRATDPTKASRLAAHKRALVPEQASTVADEEEERPVTAEDPYRGLEPFRLNSAALRILDGERGSSDDEASIASEAREAADRLDETLAASPVREEDDVGFFDPTSSEERGRKRVRDARLFEPSSMRRAVAEDGVVLLLGELAEHPRTEHVICVLFDRSKFSERAALQWWREGGREVCER
ncbi:unnamed protein product [Pelagomonas calceolata]|uniref:Uncharacterized protein n=1 Tax=Pelagomonas calceolata TaxID=35677 RepID=A0A8J2SEH2_9STRA|nr:unnamed protein product [Pelagomonas calceolata]|mmetsp:Transcript_11654/g.34655  ORF Transcript_11654/g.34655 Transcript_11654/m.34655 type:complete len:525 (-) Transcript_11654:19-1593(-)